MLCLHELKAVVIIDEHGHAFNRILDECNKIRDMFPVLLPELYENSTSDQARFECQLSGSYSPCIRFIVPFSDTDITAFLNVAGVKFSKGEYLKYTNYVAREILTLNTRDIMQEYVEESGWILCVRRISLNESGKRALVLMLDDLFGLCSICHSSTLLLLV